MPLFYEPVSSATTSSSTSSASAAASSSSKDGTFLAAVRDLCDRYAVIYRSLASSKTKPSSGGSAYAPPPLPYMQSQPHYDDDDGYGDDQLYSDDDESYGQQVNVGWCGPSCHQDHTSCSTPCRKCGQQWGVHSGHQCPEGHRGSFYIGGSAPYGGPTVPSAAASAADVEIQEKLIQRAATLITFIDAELKTFAEQQQQALAEAAKAQHGQKALGHYQGDDSDEKSAASLSSEGVGSAAGKSFEQEYISKLDGYRFEFVDSFAGHHFACTKPTSDLIHYC
jgi:hypothetical protein